MGLGEAVGDADGDTEADGDAEAEADGLGVAFTLPAATSLLSAVCSSCW